MTSREALSVAARACVGFRAGLLRSALILTPGGLSYGMATRLLAWVLGACVGVAALSPRAARAASIRFGANTYSEAQDYGKQLRLPPGFGDGEFTFELWIKPDDLFPFGSTRPTGGEQQMQNWSTADPSPDIGSTWWFEGNFLLDGHNNRGNGGTFSLQFYGSGRLRWHVDYDVVLVTPVPLTLTVKPQSLVDGGWHQVTLVRRLSDSQRARCEMWIDGQLVQALDNLPPKMFENDHWRMWPAGEAGGFNQPGWYWGAEKQAADGGSSPYEDYKGLIDEVRFWSRAKSADEISSGFAKPVTDSTGLLARFPFSEGKGLEACSVVDDTHCMTFYNAHADLWSKEEAPLSLVPGDTVPPARPQKLVID